jgi:hypothetical protein
MKRILSLCMLLLSAITLSAQIVDDFNTVTVTLKDGTKVTLYGRAWDIGDKTQEELLKQGSLKDNLTAKNGEYFYLPTNLRLSKNAQGTPQFLLLKYVTDEVTPDRDMSGALLHFLLEWGLTEEQRLECEELLRRVKPKEPQARVVGPVKLFAPEEESFAITSATTSDKGLTNSVLTSGRAPLTEGGKVAVASSLNKYGAQLMQATLEKPSGKTSVADLSITTRFVHYTKIPAVKAKMTIDWEKVAFSFAREWEEGKKVVVRPQSGSDRELNRFELNSSAFDINSVTSSGAVSIVIDNNSYSSEVTSQIESALMEIFAATINKALNSQEESEGDALGSNTSDVRDARERNKEREQKMAATGMDDRGYQFVYSKLTSMANRGTQTVELKTGIQLRNTFEITGNILEWYDGVKDNPACVSRVILNDPFFQRFRIQFVLDRDMTDVLKNELNYATVNIRKKRNDGAPFTARITLDQKFIEENGAQAAVTYAGGGDRNPDMYEYQVQYSFRGGTVFPANPVWQRGTMEAVTLYPPLKVHSVEFETDLEKLQEANIARATMQIRYRRLGEEFQTNLSLSPSKGQPTASKMIFMDRDMKGFAYRIVYDHKEDGKLATEWEAKLGAVDYIWATIPDEYRDKNSEVFQKAKELGKVIAPSGSTEGKVVDKVLDAFQILFK